MKLWKSLWRTKINSKCPHYDSILGTCNLYFVLKDEFDCLEEAEILKNVNIKGL